MKKIIIYLYLMIVLVGCKSPTETRIFDYGEEIELRLEEKAFIQESNLVVTFLDVLADSRCPKNVTCVWAGNGEVEVQINKEKVQLNTYLEPHHVSVSGINVELVRLDPYPDYPRTFEKSDYKISIIITKK